MCPFLSSMVCNCLCWMLSPLFWFIVVGIILIAQYCRMRRGVTNCNRKRQVECERAKPNCDFFHHFTAAADLMMNTIHMQQVACRGRQEGRRHRLFTTTLHSWLGSTWTTWHDVTTAAAWATDHRQPGDAVTPAATDLHNLPLRALRVVCLMTL